MAPCLKPPPLKGYFTVISFILERKVEVIRSDKKEDEFFESDLKNLSALTCKMLESGNLSITSKIISMIVGFTKICTVSSFCLKFSQIFCNTSINSNLCIPTLKHPLLFCLSFSLVSTNECSINGKRLSII
jgi:hypothetical protein